MLSRLSRASRLALVLALGTGYVAYDGLHHAAFAQGDDEDEEEEAGEDEPTEEDENPEDDKDQPPLTAGGLFTLNTYPQREISRPLTMTEGIMQVRAGLGTDLSAKGAFQSAGFSIEAVYGYKDNFSLLAGFTSAYNLKQFGVYAGFEGALIYDLLNIRLAANLYRNAIPNYSTFCTPATASDPNPPDDPEPATIADCGASMAELVLLPNGQFNSGDIRFSVDLGFPFRYAIRPEIAIVALQTLMSIDFNPVGSDFVVFEEFEDAEGNTRLRAIPTGNKVTPDLKPSIGIATNPHPAFNLTIFAQLRVPDFDTEAGAFQIPVTGRVSVSPSQKFDIGLEFTLLNVKPPDGQSPIDNRYLSIFAQSRFGR